MALAIWQYRTEPYLFNKDSVFTINLSRTQKAWLTRATIDVIEPLGPQINLNVTAGKHSLHRYGSCRNAGRVHKEIELCLDLEKRYLFGKSPPNAQIKTCL